MKILLIAGHGAGDPGAVGNGYKESDLTREVVNNVKPLLSKYATVDVYPTSRSCIQDIRNGVNQVNFANYNYVLEVHFNAGGGTGTEIYVTTSEKGTSVEQSIVNSLSKYYKNRGVKRNDWLVIKTAKNKGVSSALLEVCFIDSSNDVNVYTNNKKAIAQCIVDGIVNGFGLSKSTTTAKPTTTKPTTKPSSSGTKYSIGQTVKYNKIYSSSSSTKALTPTYTSGKITKIVKGARNPYLIGNGTGWVNDSCITNGSKATKKKSVDEVAKEVIKGLWGNGAERKNALTKAGYNYNEVQARVNEML